MSGERNGGAQPDSQWGAVGACLALCLVLLVLPLALARLGLDDPVVEASPAAVPAAAAREGNELAPEWFAAPADGETVRGERRRPDPVLRVLSRTADDDFDVPAEVATGRFLARFESQREALSRVDFTSLGVRRRGQDSAVLEGALDAESDDEPARRVRVRIVRHEDGWKVENLEAF